MAADRHSAGPAEGWGEPVAGIPSTDSASRALNGATRVLLRIAVLVGMVVCGWLLGAATGLAQEADEAEGTSDWVHVALAHDESSGPSEAVDTTASGEGIGGLLTPLSGSGVDAVVPVGGLLRLPAQVPGPDVVLQAVGPLAEPAVGAVVEPVAAQVLGTLTPQHSGHSAPSPAAQPAVAASPAPAEPADVTATTRPVPALPSPQAPEPAPASSLSGATDLAADRVTGSSAAADEHSTPTPIPASPLRTPGTSCPPGSTGANTVAAAAHAAMLSGGLATAGPALGQNRLKTGAGGLPRCPSQQPSTSPD